MKIQNFIINGGNVALTQVLIVLYATVFVLGLNHISVSGAEEQDMDFAMLKKANVTLER